MNLHFFEDYIKKMYEENKVETMFPDEKGNIRMCCPFQHSKIEFDEATWEEKEVAYYEQVPSSSINLDMRVFHCFTCDRTYKEIEFAQEVLQKDKESIIREYTAKEDLKKAHETWREQQHKFLLENNDVLQKLYDLKINMETIEELNLGYVTNCLATPVFKNGDLINIARYNINKDPNKAKNEYNKNANMGDIIPFDVWKNDNRMTIICEGEKDMIVCRSQGFNAITLTGGSQAAMQQEYINYFKGRDVYICYDNDPAGEKGALKRYKEIYEVCNANIVDISSICSEQKEDITDLFVKYGKNSNDLIYLIDHCSKKPTKEELEDVKTKYEIKLSKIENNIKNSCFRKSLKSTLQIVATCTETYAIPEYAIFKPIELGDNVGDDNIKSWYANKSHENFLELIEGKVTSRDIPNIIAEILHLNNKKDDWKKYYKVNLGPLQTVYKVTIADQTLKDDEKASDFTIDLYSKTPLDIGNIYEIVYKLYPHPKQGRKVIAIAEDIKETVYDFDTNNSEYTQSLDKFKADGTVTNKINELYESARCHIAPYLKKDVWFLLDLVFNSPLDIHYVTDIRGALDVFMLGDTRTGKSEMIHGLKELYDFGEVVPLKTATVASLIGGTDDKLKKTKLGVIPRYHKELVIMEEFSGAPVEFIKTLTEIRSSGVVKIYRVAGDIQAPCRLRMITISNPLGGYDLSSYPNGIEPLRELIPAHEDIARYDAFILFPRVEKLTDRSTAIVEEHLKIDDKHYKHKSMWIKSLTSENVKINRELGSYIFQKSVELNKEFECSFTVFGSETDKKIARMASALACMLCSTNDYKNVIVTKEHVDYIVEFVRNLYDNGLFRLKEFANEEKSYKTVVDKDTKQLEQIYPKNVTFIDFLANASKVNRNELMTVSGLNKDDFGKIFNLLVSRKFIKMNRDLVIPTVKFRNTYRIMDKAFNLADTDIIENSNVF